MDLKETMDSIDTIDRLLAEPGDALRFEVTTVADVEQLRISWSREYRDDDNKLKFAQVSRVMAGYGQLMFPGVAREGELRHIVKQLVGEGLIPPVTPNEITIMYRDHYKYLCGCELQEREDQSDDESIAFHLTCREHSEFIDEIGLKDMKRAREEAE